MDGCRLSEVSKDYLTAFYRILDEMIRDMTSAELTDSISHNFIVQMIPHHQAAIGMSRNILQYTTNLQLQEIASNIIETQTQSVEQMSAILCRCSEQMDAERDRRLYQRRMEQIMRTMFADMSCARAGNRVDCNFLREMIPHHRGAVQMSKNALQYALCPGLYPILEAIIASQERGICQMERLLRCIGCAPALRGGETRR